MTIKKITKEDSYHIDWLLQHKNHGLDTNGLSEVCKILIEKVNQLIDVTTNSLEQTEAGGQFLKTSQTKENQKSDEQLLLKHAVKNQVCDCCGERLNTDKTCPNPNCKNYDC